MKPKGKYIPVYTLILGVILGSILFSLIGYRFGNISADEAGSKVKDVYELATGANVDVMSVIKENEMYKVIAKTIDFLGQESVLEVYVSLDGKLLSERIVELDEYKTSLERQKTFIDCLDEKGLRIFGISNNTATQLQLVQILGGSRFLSKIYVDCVGENLQGCLDTGIVTVPSVTYQGEIYEGVRTIEWFEEKTGCRLEKD